MKTVLITGASRGIGCEAARCFHDLGYNVVINYNKNKSAALQLQSSLTNSIAIRADVSDENQVRAMVEEAVDRFGFIDVLVNNAGIAQQKMFTDITTDDWDKMMSVNLMDCIECGCCAYTCPAGVPLVLGFKAGKHKIRAAAAKK